MVVILRVSLQWRYNERNGVSNHRRLDCLINCLFRLRSKKTSKLHVTGFVKGNHRRPMVSPHKGSVTRKMFHLMTSSLKKKKNNISVIDILKFRLQLNARRPHWCYIIADSDNVMMTSSNGSIFRVTGHLCGEFTGQVHRRSYHRGPWARAQTFFSLFSM